MKHVRTILMVALTLLLMMSSSAWAEELYIIIDEPVQYTPVFEWSHPTESESVCLLNVYHGTYWYSREFTEEENLGFNDGYAGRLVSLDTGIDYSDVCTFWRYECRFAVGLPEDLPAGKYECTLTLIHGSTIAEGKCILEIDE